MNSSLSAAGVWAAIKKEMAEERICSEERKLEV